MIAHRAYFFAATILGIILFAGSLFVRGHYGDDYEVHANNLILLLLPFVAWLLLSGQIQRFKFGTSGMELAFQRAATSSIAVQVDRIQVQQLSIVGKEGLDELQYIVQSRPQALSFKKNSTDYYATRAVREYVTQLSKLNGFKYFVFLEANNTFLGAISSPDFSESVNMTDEQTTRGPLQFIENEEQHRPVGRRRRRHAANQEHTEIVPQLTLHSLVEILNNNRPDAVLRDLPGFISCDRSLTRTDDKKAALARMEDLNVTWLPVVDGRQKLIGIVEQSKLTASLILDVTRALELSSKKA